jgi:hypothetical protein
MTGNVSAPDPAGGPPVKTGALPAATAGTTAIPASLQGRWGLTPADCTAPLANAKGLLVINARELRFYESRAVPSGDVQTGADRMSGRFRFSGEGQSWVKFESLKRNGDKVTRTESNPAASYTYAKC